MAEKLIKARVWWKTDTLENWEANPLILGPGEPAWVRDGLGNIVDLKVGDGTRRFSELQYVSFGGSSQRGIAVFTGSGAPTVAGQEGDIYIDMATGAVYSFGTEWTDTGYSIAGGITIDDIGNSLFLDGEVLNVGAPYDDLKTNIPGIFVSAITDSEQITLADIQTPGNYRGGFLYLNSEMLGGSYSLIGGNIVQIGAGFILEMNVGEGGEFAIKIPRGGNTLGFSVGSGGNAEMSGQSVAISSQEYIDLTPGGSNHWVRTPRVDYPSGMPANPSPNTLVTKSYVDALQATITALEARIEALENA